MKKQLLFLLLFLPPIFSFSQGQIIGFTVSPASPTVNDLVTVYVDLAFSSGGCDLDSKGSSTVGNTTSASSMHCVGMLTVICTITDTFDLGYLQAGTHQFDFTLSSGSGAPGCSPGIVPDDNDSFNFLVIDPLGINENGTSNKVRFYPNPMTSSAKIMIDPSLVSENSSLNILDATGRQLISFSNLSPNEIILENTNLSSGIYFYQLLNNEEIIATDKFVVE